ncbi:MAG: hypothetical protein FWD88_08160 [Treponema sp.]|nr:hypothetical protein [Treponema sp.]
MMKRIVAALVVCVLVGGWVVAQDEPPVLTWGAYSFFTVNLARGSNGYGDLGYKDPNDGARLTRVIGDFTQYGRMYVNMTKQTNIGTVLGMVRIIQNGKPFGDVGQTYMDGYAAWRPDPMFTIAGGRGINGLMGGSAMNRLDLPDDDYGVQLYAGDIGAASTSNVFIGSGFNQGLGFAIVPIPNTLYVHVGLPYLTKDAADAPELAEILRQVNARAYYNMDGGTIGLGYKNGKQDKLDVKDGDNYIGKRVETTVGSMYLFYKNTMVDNLDLRLGLRYQLPGSVDFTVGKATKEAYPDDAKNASTNNASNFEVGLNGDYSTDTFGVYFGGTFLTYIGGEENKDLAKAIEGGLFTLADLGKDKEWYLDSRASYREVASRFSVELAPYYQVTDNVKAVLAGSFGMDLAGADYKNGEGKKSIEAQTFWGVNPYCTIAIGSNMDFQLGVQLYGNNGTLKADGKRERAVMNWAVPMTLYFVF